MPAIQFHKVTSLPGTLVADSFYLVQNGNYAEAYITNSTGVAKQLGNSAMINALIDIKIAASQAAESMIQIAADITARNALGTAATANLITLVTNATGDPTVASGSALYAYNKATTTWTKLSEFESMDVVLQWANIQGKPTSTVAAIDSAVAASHTHANKATLDLLGVTGGVLTYNGTAVDQGSQWSTNAW